MFDDVYSYIRKLSLDLGIKFPRWDQNFVLDPVLLYKLDGEDVTPSHLGTKYPYLRRMEKAFDLDDKHSKSGYDLLYNLSSESYDKFILESEDKNLDRIELLQAAIAKHNSEYVTLSPANLQIEEKELALKLWGQNTCSPDN